MKVIPDDATPVANPPFVYYMWPEIIDRQVKPVVRIHITTWEDPDGECDCLDRELPGTIRDIVHELLDSCRERARQMLWDQHRWIVAGTPETVITCSHEYDPRSE